MPCRLGSPKKQLFIRFPKYWPTPFAKHCNDHRVYDINNPPKTSTGTTKEKSKSRKILSENIGLFS